MIEWLKEPCVMGILNVTPDSFHSNSRIQTTDAAIALAAKMVSEGVAILDIGGQSTRPGAIQVSAKEEMERVVPIISVVRSSFPQLKISLDTYYADVAEAGLKLGIDLINDVSNGRLDTRMHHVAAESKSPYVLMHSRGDSLTMTKLTEYSDVVQDIYVFFEREIERLSNLGIADLVLDLGFGFAKTSEQNFQLLNELQLFNQFGLPQLVGLSRKKMIQTSLHVDAAASLNGTTVLNTIALMKGAKCLRVHDVLEAKQAIDLLRQFSFSRK